MKSGLGSQLGLKIEGPYGTFVVPDKFFEFDSESFSRDQSYHEAPGLRAGRVMQQAGRTKPTTHQAPGGFVCDVPNKGWGPVIALKHGLTVNPVQQGATAAHLQTHAIGTSLSDKSATIQINKPDVNGNDRVFSQLGAMLTGWEYGLDQSGALKANLTFDARDEDTGQPLAVAAYIADTSAFYFNEALVTTLGGNPLATVRGFRLRGTHPLRTDRFHMGSGRLKNKPIPNGFGDLSGELEAEFESMAAYDHFKAGNIIAIELPFEGDVIEGAHKFAWKASMPACQLRGSTPTVSGPDILMQRIPFKVLDNGSAAPLTETYMSTDTAL